jgi:hypothetical protein
MSEANNIIFYIIINNYYALAWELIINQWENTNWIGL